MCALQWHKTKVQIMKLEYNQMRIGTNRCTNYSIIGNGMWKMGVESQWVWELELVKYSTYK